LLETKEKDGIAGEMKLNSYKITLIDNDDGIVINAINLKNLFKQLDIFMNKNCYYMDEIISIKKM